VTHKSWTGEPWWCIEERDNDYGYALGRYIWDDWRQICLMVRLLRWLEDCGSAWLNGQNLWAGCDMDYVCDFGNDGHVYFRFIDWRY
jgi:hypothetical protein